MLPRHIKKYKEALPPTLRTLLSNVGTWLNFRQNVPIHFEKQHFTVQTVKTPADFFETLKFRYKVFHRELGKAPFGMDLTPYDHKSDLLIIKDNRTKKIVGSYRFLCSSFTNDFYSSTEFETNPFLKLPGTKLELSRACVHEDYRRGITIHLLWRGIAEYMKAVKADYLFGCTSLPMNGVPEICVIYRYLRSLGVIGSKYQVNPVEPCRIPDLDTLLKAIDREPLQTEEEREKVSVPPLLKAYIRAGAKLSPEPAFDEHFDCIDFFTVLEVDKLSDKIEKKYLQ